MREYLRTGAFGPLRMGDEVGALRSHFGEPHDAGGTSRKPRIPGIWKYGDVEFHLTDDRQRVRLIFCDHFERLSLGNAVVLESWFFEGQPSREMVEQQLTAAEIPYELRNLPHAPECEILRLESGVELVFSNGMDNMMWPQGPGLFGFQHVDPTLA